MGVVFLGRGFFGRANSLGESYLRLGMYGARYVQGEGGKGVGIFG